MWKPAVCLTQPNASCACQRILIHLLWLYMLSGLALGSDRLRYSHRFFTEKRSKVGWRNANQAEPRREGSWTVTQTASRVQRNPLHCCCMEPALPDRCFTAHLWAGRRHTYRAWSFTPLCWTPQQCTGLYQAAAEPPNPSPHGSGRE